MPPAFPSSPGGAPQGNLEVEQVSADIFDVFYVASKMKIEFHELPANENDRHRTKLMRINRKDRSLTIFPTSTSRRDTFLTPKYDRIREITLMGTDSVTELELDGRLRVTADDVIFLLEQLPRGFTKDFDYGLGLLRRYWPIVDAVEELSECSAIVISSNRPTGIDAKTRSFVISRSDFERLRKKLDSIRDVGQAAVRSVKAATSHNILAALLGKPTIPVRAGRHPIRKLITAAAEGKLDPEDQDELLTLLAENTKVIAEEKPRALARVKADIETVTLEHLVEQFEKKLAKNLEERYWQDFLNQNPFIFHLAFGYPVVRVQDQASVGGVTLAGSGGKIADFLAKNPRTKNAAIIEIKKPSAHLLNQKPLRAGVYTPSAELSGSINQVLDQKYHFQKQIATLKDNSGIHDIESYSVHCCLIIGTMPQEKDRIKSFELFRTNSKNVEVVTFDELLEKLTQLHKFLAARGEGST